MGAMCSNVLTAYTFSVKGNIKGANTSPLRIKHHRTAHRHQSNAIRNLLSAIENFIDNNISIAAAKNIASFCIAFKYSMYILFLLKMEIRRKEANMLTNRRCRPYSAKMVRCQIQNGVPPAKWVPGELLLLPMSMPFDGSNWEISYEYEISMRIARMNDYHESDANWLVSTVWVRFLFVRKPQMSAIPLIWSLYCRGHRSLNGISCWFI